MKALGIPHDPQPVGNYVRDVVIPAAMKLVPPRLDSLEARALLHAICMQESRGIHRRQIKGPARGLWQFEYRGGFLGVLQHPASRPILLPILEKMAYQESECWPAIENNDVLACVFARLLLWTHPKALPEGNPNEAWDYYLDTWRPGKPHRSSWDAFYLDAWTREVA
jgi:hypothetical protein